MTTVLILAIIVVVVILLKKKNKSSDQAASAAAAQVSAEFSTGETADFLSNPVLAAGLAKLKAVVVPDKHGDYNDCKKVGKTIAKINEEVSAVLTPGSEEYINYFHALYRTVIGSMRSSSDNMMSSAMEYTLIQQEEWMENGKCQTFVKGLSDDPLVAEAEVIMAACEKCWFKNIKTTMWRKDMEKYNLPKSL